MDLIRICIENFAVKQRIKFYCGKILIKKFLFTSGNFARIKCFLFNTQVEFPIETYNFSFVIVIFGLYNIFVLFLRFLPYYAMLVVKLTRRI